MAKRGETRPWRVTYLWTDSGIHGTESFSSEQAAKDKADVIRENGVRREMDVVVTVAHR